MLASLHSFSFRSPYYPFFLNAAVPAEDMASDNEYSDDEQEYYDGMDEDTEDDPIDEDVGMYLVLLYLRKGI